MILAVMSVDVVCGNDVMIYIASFKNASLAKLKGS